MRDDLDTARGVIWWAVLPLLLLVVSGSAFASPTTTVYVCVQGGVSSGDAFESCGAPYTVAAGFVAPGALVNAQADGLEDKWYRQEDLDTGFNVWSVAGDAWVPASSVSGWGSYGFEGLGGGGAGGDWTLEDLDLPRFAGVFATFFTICGLFWALGKGVGLVVGFLRRV